MQFHELKDSLYLKIGKGKLDEALTLMHQHFGNYRKQITLLQADYSEYNDRLAM